MDSTHTFNTAHFTDNERTVIEVYWEKDGVIRTENIPAKAGDTRYKNLMTHLNIDQLHENTYKYIRVQDEAYQNDVIVAAKERGLIYDVNSINSNIYKALVETLLAPFDPVEDKEKLFMTKLQIFEVEAIKTDNRLPLPNTKGNASRKHEPQKVIGRGVCKVLSDEEVKREKEEKRRRVEAMEKAAEKTADIERKRLEAIKQERKF